MRAFLSGTFEELHAVGCIQTGADVRPNVDDARSVFGELFRGLMILTKDHPCNGCPVAGKCEAQKQYEVIDTESPGPLEHLVNLGFERLLQTMSGKGQQTTRTAPVKPKKEQAPPRPRCPRCGLKIRSDSHDQNCRPRSG